MENNVRQFLVHGPVVSRTEAGGLMEKTEDMTRGLVGLMAEQGRGVADPEVLKAVGELIDFVNATNGGIDMGEQYWPYLAEQYTSNSNVIQGNDKKYGEGASRLIGLAQKAYLKQA